jgi:tetratricopeptide (TPR) repeat protein
MHENDPIKQMPPVYAQRVSLKLGALGTERTQEAESYYLANFLPDGQVELTLIDYQDKPTQITVTVSIEELEDQYLLIQDYFSKKKTPHELKEAKHIALGDRHLAKAEFYSAEFEFDTAISVNPKSVRGNYGKGKALLERGEVEEAEKVFEGLSDINELYDKMHKHTFNLLGIDLRKMGKFDEAIRNYQKAISMDPADEVLHYNIAHAYYKKRQIKEAVKHLKQALAIKPNFVEGKRFLAELSGNGTASA